MAERLSEQNHPGHAPVGADQPGEPEQGAAENRADPGREERPLEPERSEESACDYDEQADPQAPPQKRDVEEGQRPQPLRHRSDSPGAILVPHPLSLRWHDPDQVLRVEALEPPLSR